MGSFWTWRGEKKIAEALARRVTNHLISAVIFDFGLWSVQLDLASVGISMIVDLMSVGLAMIVMNMTMESAVSKVSLFSKFALSIYMSSFCTSKFWSRLVDKTN